MREYGDNANIAKARGLSLQGGVFGIVLAFVSMVTIRLGPIETSLALLPLMAVFMWPRGSSAGLSSVFIFAIGFVVDIVTAGPLGLWTFIYLAFYGVFQPDKRTVSSHLNVLWPQFIIWISLAVCIVLVIGRLFIPGRTALTPLLMQGVTTVLAFPVLLSIRQGLRQLVSDSDDTGYVK